MHHRGKPHLLGGPRKAPGGGTGRTRWPWPEPHSRFRSARGTRSRPKPRIHPPGSSRLGSGSSSEPGDEAARGKNRRGVAGPGPSRPNVPPVSPAPPRRPAKPRRHPWRRLGASIGRMNGWAASVPPNHPSASHASMSIHRDGPIKEVAEARVAAPRVLVQQVHGGRKVRPASNPDAAETQLRGVLGAGTAFRSRAGSSRIESRPREVESPRGFSRIFRRTPGRTLRSSVERGLSVRASECERRVGDRRGGES